MDRILRYKNIPLPFMSYILSKVNACSELHKYNGIESLWTCAAVLLFSI